MLKGVNIYDIIRSRITNEVKKKLDKCYPDLRCDKIQ